MNDPLLKIEDLHIYYVVPIGNLKFGYRKVWVLKGIDLEVSSRTVLGIVGGSGSGKSTILRAILGFVKPARGRILYQGINLLKLKPRDRKKIAKEISYVPQEPSQSINPKMSIEDVLTEPLKSLGIAKSDIDRRIDLVLEMLDLDRSIRKMYAKELSGGMLQRIAIARAIISKPRLVLLDEPTSNLDISIQAQILNMLKDLKEELGLTYAFVSHDIDVVGYIADRIAVIASGKIVEEGPTEEILKESLHPYTQLLLNPEKTINKTTINNNLCPITGWCPWKTNKCETTSPPKTRINNRYIYCWRYTDLK
ncbi:MAG: ABC transporter ATP-binding protein [Ignisphaera sp.]|uniref:ABC transporter ATP-binding protein n=1 Tax=Ignisphaera aggregans TaxID=334771 RepID=A0A7J3MYD7_9CREN